MSRPIHPTRLDLSWRKHGGRLAADLSRPLLPPAPRKKQIEKTTRRASGLGAPRVASRHRAGHAAGVPEIWRTPGDCGDLYAWLVHARRPATIVGLGAACAASGLYVVSALEAAGAGHLYGFEANPAWADDAERNLRRLGSRFTMTRGAFEEHLTSTVPAPIDLALVAGIGTPGFVLRLIALLGSRMASGGLIALHGIDDETAGMRGAWERIAGDPQVAAAVEVTGRVGLMEWY